MTPVLLEADGPQAAWYHACRHLLAAGGEAWNLIVHIADPRLMDEAFHSAYDEFCVSQGLLRPRHVIYTIFPYGLVRGRTTEQFFESFNRNGGMFDRLQQRKPRWGSYFRRMTHYRMDGHVINQLGDIIGAINNRDSVHRAAYSMLIQHPGGETVQPRGGPCLNYVAVQIVPDAPQQISLMAVYRNHDFLGHAYGNYIGLGYLLSFICEKTGSVAGSLTCHSSHAYLNKRRAVQALLDEIQMEGLV